MLIATERKPDIARTLADQLQTALSQDDFETAFEVTESMIECWPESTGAWTAAGLMALKLGRLEDASYRLGSALTLAPSNFDAHYNLALVDLQRGCLDAALKRLLRLRRDYPDNADLLNDIGVFWLRKQRPTRAVASFVRCLTIDPNHGDAHENVMTLCLQNGWTEQAKRALDGIESQTGLTSQTRNRIGRWRLKLKRPEELDMNAFVTPTDQKEPVR
jgi:Flp pilus assembly protein TadD